MTKRTDAAIPADEPPRPRDSSGNLSPAQKAFAQVLGEMLAQAWARLYESPDQRANQPSNKP